ncbi:nucleoside phosphorylase [Candidatus Saccharibacteria bacterium]|nr:nucleoside phosphorylase [Candidatus Saccharibacteria bacterium]
MIIFDDSASIVKPGGYGGLDGVDPKIGIMMLEGDNLERLQAQRPTTPVTNIFGQALDTPVILDGTDVLLTSPTGGAEAVMDMELMIASGVDTVIAYGTAGALYKNMETGTIIIPTAATRDEGTSYHYMPDTDEVEQNPETLAILREEMHKCGIEWVGGKTWTTDAIYRETVGKREMMKERGCVCVDMECASLLAVAKFRGISFVQFLIILDNIDEDAPKTDYGLYQQRYREELFDMALAAAQRIRARRVGS